jgi:hypothetical protein
MTESAMVPDALGSVSKRLAAALFAAIPEARNHVSMFQSGEADGQSLIVRIPSPSGDSERCVQIWVDEVATPTIEFGPTHTHCSADHNGVAEVVDLCQAILQDNLLIIQDVGGQHDGSSGWLDVRGPEALTEELTDPYSPGSAKLKSWSGRADRDVGLESL